MAIVDQTGKPTGQTVSVGQGDGITVLRPASPREQSSTSGSRGPPSGVGLEQNCAPRMSSPTPQPGPPSGSAGSSRSR